MTVKVPKLKSASAANSLMECLPNVRRSVTVSSSPQLEGLSDSFTVIAWDAPGAGQSQDPREGFDIGGWADALAGVLDAADVQQAHIIGLSWGGLLAQEFYRRYPSRLFSLALVDTYAGWIGSLTAPIAEQRLQAALNDSTLAPDDFVKKYLPGMFSDSVGADTQRELASSASAPMWCSCRGRYFRR